MPWDLHGKFKYVDSNFKSIFRRQKKIGPSRACSRKGICDIFQQKEKKGQRMIKRAKCLKIWARMYKIWKCFEKGYIIIFLKCFEKLLEKALPKELTWKMPVLDRQDSYEGLLGIQEQNDVNFFFSYFI